MASGGTGDSWCGRYLVRADRPPNPCGGACGSPAARALGGCEQRGTWGCPYSLPRGLASRGAVPIAAAIAGRLWSVRSVV